MASDVGITYRFAVPNPNTMMLRASLVIGMALSFLSILIMCLIGYLPIYSLAIVLSMSVGAAFTDRWGRSVFGGDSGAVMAPDFLVIKRGERASRYAWHDISTIALGAEADFSGFEAFLYRRLYAPFSPSRVRVSFRRPVGAGHVGPAQIRLRKIDLYLAEPEAFVEEARRHLASTPASSG